jgi:hypothetical protein
MGVPEIEQVFLSQNGEGGLSALIVINKKNYAVLNRIFKSESDIIKAIPGTSVNFDVVIRDGRPLGDVARPRGKLLFQR